MTPGRKWRPRQESNLHLAFRRGSFYPLNYEDLCRAASLAAPHPPAQALINPENTAGTTKEAKYTKFQRL